MKGARTVHTHCTLCTRSFPRAHLHLRSWWTAIDIPPPLQLATSFLTLNFNVRKWLKTCSIHCFAHSHKTVAINLPTPSFYGKNAWSCCVTPRDLIPWEPLVLFHLTCKVTLFFPLTSQHHHFLYDSDSDVLQPIWLDLFRQWSESDIVIETALLLSLKISLDHIQFVALQTRPNWAR